jgi:hypothetical protein
MYTNKLCAFVFQHCQGNFEAASNVYKEALEMASMKKMLHSLPILYIHFSRLTYTVGDLCKTNFSNVESYQLTCVLFLVLV